MLKKREEKMDHFLLPTQPAPPNRTLGPTPFIAILEGCTLLLTDSGGIQEEAPSFGKPVLVMRDTTERPEAIDAGTVKLVGTDPKTIVEQVLLLLQDDQYYQAMAKSHNPCGDGKAAGRIVDWLCQN